MFKFLTRCSLTRRSLGADAAWLRAFSSAPPSESSLTGHLKAKIKMKGPLTVQEYMKEALGHPKWGYYMKKDVFGAQGDFTTSPEVSQMFGELVGVWFLNEWQILKQLYGDDLPRGVQLVELGPGRGTLMSDQLKVWSRHKEASQELCVYMVETSPFLRKVQMKNLCAAPSNEGEEPKLKQAYKSKHSASISVTWLEDISEVPRKDTAHFVLANEFFDALPIQKFQKTPAGFREVLVGVDSKTDELGFVVSTKETVGSRIILKLHPTHAQFDHVEVSAESARYMEAISNVLKNANGSALLIDYGHDGVCKDTFRAFKSHKLVENVFTTPGECDLTVDVDFSFLKHIASKSNVVCYGPVNQSQFLTQMQIGARFKALLRNCKTESDRTRLTSEFGMLVNDDKMGSRFKMIALRKFDLKQAPPGFIAEK